VDVYFLKREKLGKEMLMRMARRKDPGFDTYWLGAALERINEFSADSPEMLLLFKPCTFDELQGFYDKWMEIFQEISKG